MNETTLHAAIIVLLLAMIGAFSWLVVTTIYQSNCDSFGKIKLQGVVYSCIEEAS